MTSVRHPKHAELARPVLGNFGRNEYALLGAPCTVIRELADRIIEDLSPVWQCVYADALHRNEKKSGASLLHTGNATRYTDCGSYAEVTFSAALSTFHQRNYFAGADLILVNGNHHPAQKQVVVLHPEKAESLKRKTSRVSNVSLFLLADGVTEIYDFLQSALPEWEKIPRLCLNDGAGILSFFHSQMKLALPQLNGLVLAGGKSVRLGKDKGRLNWHGMEQRLWMAGQLQPFCRDVLISCREEQLAGIGGPFQLLPDSFTGLGPFGAMLSAFRHQPEKAWLVVACDLPLLDAAALQFLTEKRNPASIATAFQSPVDAKPEPLAAIWEPKSYPVLLAFLAQGYSCPRKVLQNQPVTMLEAPDAAVLLNVNTEEEYRLAMNRLKPAPTPAAPFSQ